MTRPASFEPSGVGPDSRVAAQGDVFPGSGPGIFGNRVSADQVGTGWNFPGRYQLDIGETPRAKWAGNSLPVTSAQDESQQYRAEDRDNDGSNAASAGGKEREHQRTSCRRGSEARWAARYRFKNLPTTAIAISRKIQRIIADDSQVRLLWAVSQTVLQWTYGLPK